MANGLSISIDKMIPVTVARRTLGKLVDRLITDKEFYFIRGGKIVAKLMLPEEVERTQRQKIIDEVKGAWKGTDLDDDKLWKEILIKEREKRSRKKSLVL